LTRVGFPGGDLKDRNKVFREDFGWDKELVKKIWSFGPDTTGANLLIDGTKGVQYLNEIKDSIIASFQVSSREGPIADEALRNCKFEIMDCVIHRDASHRGGGQIIPATRRCLYASLLCAAPRLMEPFYLVEIQTPERAIGGIYATLSVRRGQVLEELSRAGSAMRTVKAFMPVYESLQRDGRNGFSADLRASTAGQAFPQCVFDHWEVLESDPLKEGSVANNIVNDIRKRKGLKPDIPNISAFEDKL